MFNYTSLNILLSNDATVKKEVGISRIELNGLPVVGLLLT